MGAIAVSRAGMAKEPTQRDCEELKKINEKRRQHVQRNSGDRRLKSKKGRNKQEGTTISSCKFQGGGKAKCASAHSNHVAHERFKSEFVEGGNDKVRTGKVSVMCSKKKHKRPYIQKSGHAEARIFDTLSQKTGLKMVFKIDWRPTSGPDSNLPCPACQRLMCIAMECKHQIWLCNAKDEPQQLTKEDCATDENGNITRGARNSLVKKMRVKKSR